MQQPNTGHSQSMIPQPQQPVIVYQVVPSTESVISNYKSTPAIILGSFQVVMGILCFALQSATFASNSATMYLGTGYWCGLFFLLAGAFAIVSSKKRTHCWIVACMVLSIFAAIMAAVVISSCSAILMISYLVTQPDPSSHYYYRMEVGRALDGVMIGLGVVELVLAICTSAICCGSVCCKRYSQVSAQYVGGQPQPVIINTQAGYQQNAIYPSIIPQDKEMAFGTQ